MPAISLVWYQSKVKRIMRDVASLKRREIAEIKGITHQAASKGIVSGKYQRELADWIQILDLAGYEIVEKEPF